MRILNATGTSVDVSTALDMAIESINSQLSKVPGSINTVDIDINLGVVEGATVTITIALNGSLPIKKGIIGVNVRGVSREQSIKKASDTLNKFLENKDGEIVYVYQKTVDTHLPGRVYTTLIVAVNEKEIQEVRDAEERRERLKTILQLLGNDPSAINIARVAEIFGVSRTIIYRDLETLGMKRFAK